jgi:hypothetical protein
MIDIPNPLSSSDDEADRTYTDSSLNPNSDFMPPEGSLESPVSRAAVAVAREQNPDLRERGRADDLVEVLNRIQQWVENHEYQNRRGNAFFERLVQDFNDDGALRRPALVSEGEEWAELIFVVLAEGWADIQDELDLLEEEVRAARDAHQLHAVDRGLAEYSSLVCLMAVRVRPPRAISILEESDPAPDILDLRTDLGDGEDGAEGPPGAEEMPTSPPPEPEGEQPLLDRDQPQESRPFEVEEAGRETADAEPDEADTEAEAEAEGTPPERPDTPDEEVVMDEAEDGLGGDGEFAFTEADGET